MAGVIPIPITRPVGPTCRATYCLFADETVALLRRHGFDAVRLDAGWPKWWAEGRRSA
jgi:hypothetical protein